MVIIIDLSTFNTVTSSWMLFFLHASSHIYKKSCPLVGMLVVQIFWLLKTDSDSDSNILLHFCYFSCHPKFISIHSLIHSLIYSFICSFILQFIHSFIYSFIHLIIHSLKKVLSQNLFPRGANSGHNWALYYLSPHFQTHWFSLPCHRGKGNINYANFCQSGTWR